MDRQKVFKKETNNILYRGNKNMNNNNNMISIKDFKNQSNFNAKVDIQNITNKSELNKKIELSKSKKTYFFEWTDYKSNVKPFYDIDAWYEDKDEFETNKDLFQNEAREILGKYYPQARIAVSSSHGKKIKKGKEGWAISFHMVLYEYDTTIQKLREFNEKNNLYDLYFKGTKIKIFDKAVYRDGGNMRMIYSYKPNDDRQKIPVSFTDYPTFHIIQSCEMTNGPYARKSLPSSPASSPPASPNATDEEEEEEETIEFVPVKKNYNLNELKEIIELCKVQDECYEYFEWLKIGMALHNITDGDDVGLGLFKDFTSEYEGFKNKTTKRDIHYKWKSFGKEKDGNKLGLTFLRKLKEKYIPNDCKSLQSIYMAALEAKQNGGARVYAKNEMLKEMNKRLIYIKKTSNFVVPSFDTLVKYDDEGNMIHTTQKDTYDVKAIKDVKLDFQKENFEYTATDEDGKTKNIKVNPLNEWLNWSERNEKEKIDFDPRNIDNPYIFNIWKGYNITKDDCEEYDEDEAQPVIDHIKNIWCNNNEEDFQYVIKYLAHIIQKPYKKTGVCLALHSKQGAGKGVILKKLENIIGDNHYSQNSNAERVFGKFNGLLEGKTLINLDEAFWGGDKKLEGQIKNHITEDKQTVEKKSINQYNIHDYCNYIITTNNDWFAGVEEGDRRYFCLELSNEFAGRANDENEKYFNKIRNVPTESFGKYLYNIDLSDFNPRKFKKTALLQEQVERNHNSPKVWWNTVMRDGGFEYEGNFIEWGKKLVIDEYSCHPKRYGLELTDKQTGEKKVVYDKDWLFKVYESKSYDGRKFSNATFWKEIQKNCLGKKLYVENKIQRKNQRKIFIFLPDLEEARQTWYQFQEYDYKYGDKPKIEDQYDFDMYDDEW